METFKTVAFNSNYEISNFGTFRNKNTGIIFKGSLWKKGYKAVSFIINGTKKNMSIHRLVAIHFIPNSENKKTVNHKDGNKLNNHFSNLEWATYSENSQHSYDTGLKLYRPLHYVGKKGYEHNRSKEVFQYSLSGKYIGAFGSVLEACRNTGISYSDISKCASGKTYRADKYIWSYKKFNKNNFPKKPIHSLSKKVGMYKNDKLIKTFESNMKAANFVKCDPSSISDCARGKAKLIKGYVWKYL